MFSLILVCINAIGWVGACAATLPTIALQHAAEETQALLPIARGWQGLGNGVS